MQYFSYTLFFRLSALPINIVPNSCLNFIMLMCVCDDRQEEIDELNC